MYHSHHNAAKQVPLGLLGAFIVEPRNPRPIEKVDREYLMVLNDGQHGYTLNGKASRRRTRWSRRSARRSASAT
jgi:FtsP/CotA-like multicopper oxidase with cupredoxin domain